MEHFEEPLLISLNPVQKRNPWTGYAVSSTLPKIRVVGLILNHAKPQTPMC